MLVAFSVSPLGGDQTERLDEARAGRGAADRPGVLGEHLLLLAARLDRLRHDLRRSVAPKASSFASPTSISDRVAPVSISAGTDRPLMTTSNTTRSSVDSYRPAAYKSSPSHTCWASCRGTAMPASVSR